LLLESLTNWTLSTVRTWGWGWGSFLLLRLVNVHDVVDDGRQGLDSLAYWRVLLQAVQITLDSLRQLLYLINILKFGGS
jgi:hypothetical protein